MLHCPYPKMSLLWAGCITVYGQYKYWPHIFNHWMNDFKLWLFPVQALLCMLPLWTVLHTEKAHRTQFATLLTSLHAQKCLIYNLWYWCSHTWKLYTYLIRFVASESGHLGGRLDDILSYYGEVSLYMYRMS